MAIDLAVSREIIKLRALERAVHDSGPWTVRVQGTFHRAERVVLSDCVRFTVTIPAHNGVTPDLFCRNEQNERNEWVFSFAPILPSSGETTHAFELALSSRVAA